jgi:hypothetical protein
VPAIRGRRDTAIRIGVVVCVAVAVVLAALRLDEVQGLFDFRADQNASLGYLDRLYADGGVAGSQRVVEDALAWMPPDATYRVLVGPHMTGVAPFTRLVAEDFLEYFLLPRRRAESEPTPWVFCYGCDVSALGPSFHVLSDGGNGVLFGRVDT